MSEPLKDKRLFNDAYWALAGQATSACALLIGTRVLTELVSPEVYGQVALLNGFVALGVALFSYPFICAGMRIMPECQHQNEQAALYVVINHLLRSSLVLAISLLALCGGIYRYFTDVDAVLLILIGALLTVTVQREQGIQLLISKRKQRAASLWQTSDSFLRPTLAITLVLWGGQKPEWVLFGYILASLLTNSIGLFFSNSPSNDKVKTINRKIKAEIWTYALPLIPMELLFWINGLGDRYIIGYFMTAAEVGLYAATYLIINEAFNRSAMVLLRTFQPAFFQAYSQNQPKEALRILWIWIRCVVALGIIGVFVLYLTKDWIAVYLLAKSYHSAVALMPAIAIGCSLHALGTVVAQPLLAKKQTRLILIGRLCGAVAAAISIPLMVKNFGLFGAAMANPIYFGIETIVLLLLAKPWQLLDNTINNHNGLETSDCNVTA